MYKCVYFAYVCRCQHGCVFCIGGCFVCECVGFACA